MEIRPDWEMIEAQKNQPGVYERIIKCYHGDKGVFLEIRQYCYRWIEKKNWSEFSEIPEEVDRIFQEFIRHVDDLIANPSSSLVQIHRLRQGKKAIEEYGALKFLKLLIESLREETKLLNELRQPHDEGTEDSEESIPPKMPAPAAEEILAQLIQLESRAFSEKVTGMEEILKKVWQHVDKWKEDCKQEMTGLSKPAEKALDLLNDLCRDVNKALISLAQTAQAPDVPTILQLILQHLNRIYVIEQQPFTSSKRVVRIYPKGTSNPFALRCRILGGDGLGLEANANVSVRLFNASDIGKTSDGICVGVIRNGQSGQMDAQTCAASINTLQLLEVPVPVPVIGTSGQDSIQENYHVFRCCTELRILQNVFPVKTISLPVMLNFNMSQECAAIGHLMWHAAFSLDASHPENPKEISWKNVSQLLNALFTKSTKRSLPSNQLDYLKKLAFGETGTGQRRTISKKRILSDNLSSGRKFTFWMWFYANLHLVEEHLCQEWKAEVIYGFISKEQTNTVLKNKDPGTFLVRFSDGNIEKGINGANGVKGLWGQIRVAVVEIDPKTNRKKVYHLDTSLEKTSEIFEKGLCAILMAYKAVDTTGPNKRRLLALSHKGKHIEDMCEAFVPGPMRSKDSTNDGYRPGNYIGGELSIDIYLNEKSRKPTRRSQRTVSNSSVKDRSSGSNSENEPINNLDFSSMSLAQPVGQPTAATSQREPSNEPMRKVVKSGTYTVQEYPQLAATGTDEEVVSGLMHPDRNPGLSPETQQATEEDFEILGLKESDIGEEEEEILKNTDSMPDLGNIDLFPEIPENLPTTVIDAMEEQDS